ncbi:unnamed protein product [Ectocarpus sp. 8 AP-2014]
MNALKNLAWTLLKWPLKTLYKKGPRILYLWEGLSEEIICYEMTKVDAFFWSSSEDSMWACEELISRKFEAFVVCVYGFLFAYLAYTLFCIKAYEYVARTRINALLESENKALGLRDKHDVSKTKS